MGTNEELIKKLDLSDMTFRNVDIDGLDFEGSYGVKINPQIVFDIIQLVGVTKEQTLYVGDSGVDMQTAVAAGVDSVGVLWGFRTADELLQNGASSLVAQPSEILGKV